MTQRLQHREINCTISLNFAPIKFRTRSSKGHVQKCQDLV